MLDCAYLHLGSAEMIQGGSNSFPKSDTSIKVLLADDSEVVRRGIRQLLSTQAEVAIVGEAASFAPVIQLANDLAPHVVVLDLHMPDENNIPPQEVKSRLNHGSQLLAMSVWDDEDSKRIAANLGAAAFLDKMHLARTLIPTILQLKQACSAEG